MKSALLVGLTAALFGRYTAAQTTPDVSAFDWSSVQPSTSLKYTICYDTYKCTKLSVPLDWLSDNNNATSASNSTADRVILAIIALPAVVPESDPSFGGTVIVNPGGPGGSGVQFLLEAGPTLQNTTDGTKHYEILSFDPRGVGFTEPKADCYNDEFARSITTIELRAMGALDSSLDAVRRQTALYGARGQLCAAGPDIHRYMSTSSVARDMVEIVDKLDELRKLNGTALNSRGMRRIRQRQDSDVPRIQYWGFSYGTVIGNYFASMFPGRVGRMVLEGVVDVHDYYGGTWAKNLQDTQKDLSTLWTTCFTAGSACALYQPTDTSADDIRVRAESFINSLEETPAQLVVGAHVEEVTKADINNNIFSALYRPLLYFPTVATILALAMAGNFTSAYSLLGVPQSPAAYCPSTAPTSYTWTLDAELAVGCGDAMDQTNLTTPEYLAYLKQQLEFSPDFGADWTSVRLACKGWRSRPAYRFGGPWTTPEADPSIVPGKPAAPILFLSSEFDPVTPRANAIAMAAEHPGSVVLTQSNAGHGTLGTPGKCRDGWINKYFETGELPPDGTVCEPDCTPFQECPQMPTAQKRSLDGKKGVPVSLPKRKGPLHMW
ncbi:TAP-like protein-domain-containing protein [Hypoxylon crocopeplum]|nr:TAP-like protein-domain-containing protein [Hypoxylon crocopeplum]